MFVAFVSLALQLSLAPVSALGPGQGVSSVADSVRGLRRARNEQASFERTRRSMLPVRGGSGGRCDVRVGRYCWWYDGAPIDLPPEHRTLSRRRDALLRVLDSLSEGQPGDEWIAGMRVHYRVDAGRAAAADSVARACRSAEWWCEALVGYANHAMGRSAAAESAYTRAIARMPERERCEWRDISVLLPGGSRRRYEKQSCADRVHTEERYWALSRPQLAAPANEWRTEFLSRRVLSRLAERGVWPQPGYWGNDSAELTLRYGWPVGWSRVEAPVMMTAEPQVVGHDPVPSFSFGPDERLLDTLAASRDDGWRLHEPVPESRFGPRLVRRVAAAGMQVARFRRGDSALVVASYTATDDSLGAGAIATLGATLHDGTSWFAHGEGGRATLRLPATPLLAGVDIADTTKRALARARELFAPPRADSGLVLSDLLLYHAAGSPPESLDAALAHAVPSDTLVRSRPVGVYWESYGVAASGENLDVAVTVERIDRSWLRSARQRVRLAPQDSPIRLRWNDARPRDASAAASRAISLNLGNLDAGRYRITVGVTRSDGTLASTVREMELRAR